MLVQTEFEFELPKGYIDETGTLIKKGAMRLATAADEILPMRDPRVKSNPEYLPIILLARVITRLGEHKEVSTTVVESLFSRDFAYLQEFYNQINETGSPEFKMECPKCQHHFTSEVQFSGESLLTQ